MIRSWLLVPLLCGGCAAASSTSGTTTPAREPGTRGIALVRALAAGTQWTDEVTWVAQPSTTCGSVANAPGGRLRASVTVVSPGSLEPVTERVEIIALEVDGPTLTPGTLVDVDRSARAITVRGATVDDAVAAWLRRLIDPGIVGGQSELATHLWAFATDAEVVVGGSWSPDRARFDPILTRTRSGHPWTGALDARAQWVELVETPHGPAQRIAIHTRVETTDVGAGEGRTAQEGHVVFDIEVLVPLDRTLPILEDRFEVSADLTYVNDASGEVCENHLRLSHTHHRSEIRTARP